MRGKWLARGLGVALVAGLVAGAGAGLWWLVAHALWWLVAHARTDETLEERRAKVVALSPAAKEALLERYRRFVRLDPAEQDRVRRLHAALVQDAQGAELRQVMLQYYDWLKTLAPYQQAELRELAPAQRVQQIKRLLEWQAQRRGKAPALAESLRDYRLGHGLLPPAGKRGAWLSPQDIEGLLQWFEQYVARHADQILRLLPEAQRQQLSRELAQTKDPLRRHELLIAMWLRWQLDNPGKGPLPDAQDLAELRSRLSPETRRRLEQRPAPEQWRLLSGVIPMFMLQQYAARRMDGAFPAVTEEELAQFFEKELKPMQRDQLLNLPADDMARELWRMYLRWKLAQLPRAKERRLPAAPGESPRPSARPKGVPKIPPSKPTPSKPLPSKPPVAKAAGG